MSAQDAGYLSIKAPVTAEQTIKKSRFICLLTPVKTKGEAEDVIKAVKKAHYNARHNCSAYILGQSRSEFRYNDDGEPQGTGGLPILEALQKRGVTDILAVVTRYFGGILLGAGGLARAYGGTAAMALNAAETVEYVPASIYRFEVDYADYAKLEAVVRQFGGCITSGFEDKVSVRAEVDKTASGAFLKQVADAFSGAVTAVPEGSAYIERNV